MVTDTAPAIPMPPLRGRTAHKVWLYSTEVAMLNDLANRGHMSKSASIRAAILATWERTFRRGPTAARSNNLA